MDYGAYAMLSLKRSQSSPGFIANGAAFASRTPTVDDLDQARSASNSGIQFTTESRHRLVDRR